MCSSDLFPSHDIVSFLIMLLIKQHTYHTCILRLERQNSFDLGCEYGGWIYSAEYHKGIAEIDISERHFKYAKEVKASAEKLGIKV